MGNKKTIRIVLDIALTVMIVLEMFIQFTGTFLHEVIGFAFFACVVAHLALSAKWIKSTAQASKKGKMNARRKALAIMGMLLAINVLVLGVSSVAISNLLADAGFVWGLGSYALWATIHSVSAYMFCALVALHLGMHWVFLASALHVPYNPARRRAIGVGVNTVATVGALALGVIAVREAFPDSSNTGTTSQSSNSGSSTGNSSSTPTGTESFESGKRKAKAGASSSDSASASGSSGDSGTTGSTGSSGAPGNSSSSGSSGTSGNSGSTGTSGNSGTSGICTLCRKQCPLSSPKCNKPYEAGLI